MCSKGARLIRIGLNANLVILDRGLRSPTRMLHLYLDLYTTGLRSRWMTGRAPRGDPRGRPDYVATTILLYTHLQDPYPDPVFLPYRA